LDSKEARDIAAKKIKKIFIGRRLAEVEKSNVSKTAAAQSRYRVNDYLIY
jgi:hypothetical protein